MDSIDKIVACMQAAAKSCQQTPPTEQAIRHIIGLRLDKAMAKLFPEVIAEKHAEMIEAYYLHYMTLDSYETPFYPGIHSWLIDLKAQGYLLAVATGKGRNSLNRILDNFSVNDLFTVTYCADETASKPNPLMLNRILSDLNIDAADALMVGDSSYDLEMAQNANIDSLAVSYGVHDKDTLIKFNPIAIVDDLPKEFALYVQ